MVDSPLSHSILLVIKPASCPILLPGHEAGVVAGTSVRRQTSRHYFYHYLTQAGFKPTHEILVDDA